MTQKPNSQSRLRFTRLNVSIAAAVFLTLAGTGVASASWTAPPAATSSTVNTGTLTVSQAVSPALDMNFNSAGAATQTKTVAVTVSNSGSTNASYTLTLANSSGNAALANAIAVTSWTSSPANPCTDAATPPNGTAAKTWTTATAVNSAVAAGSSVVYCVRTALATSQITATTVGSMTANLTLSANAGSWTSGNAVTVTQNAVDTTVPSTPGTPVASGTTLTQTTLTWTASTDNIGVTGYKIYRGATLVTTTTATSYTDTSAPGATTSSYTVQAVDAAGNVSAASGATSVTTAPVPTTPYKVTHSSGLCLDDNASNLSAGNPILVYTCYGPPTNPNGSPNQQWKFNADGTVRVGIAGASMVLRATSNAAGAGIVLGAVGDNRTTWKLVASSVAGQYLIQRADNAALCLDAGTNPASSTQVTQKACSDTPAQRFTMTGMN